MLELIFPLCAAVIFSPCSSVRYCVRKSINQNKKKYHYPDHPDQNQHRKVPLIKIEKCHYPDHPDQSQNKKVHFIKILKYHYPDHSDQNQHKKVNFIKIKKCHYPDHPDQNQHKNLRSHLALPRIEPGFSSSSAYRANRWDTD